MNPNIFLFTTVLRRHALPRHHDGILLTCNLRVLSKHRDRIRSTGARLGELNDEIVDWVNRENRGASDNKSELSTEETKDNGNQWHAHPSLTPMSPPPPSCDRRHCLSPPAIRPKIILLPDGTSKRILIPSNTIQT